MSTGQDTNTESLPKAGYLLLLALSIFWGLNWPFMKIILSELPLWWFRASCVFVGGGALLAISAASGNRITFQLRELPAIAFCALFSFMGWHILSAHGVSLMPAGRAVIIAFTMPVWAALFSSMLLGERFNLSKVMGLVLGVAGLVVLIGDDVVALQKAPLGAAFMLAAAISWGFGTVLFKRGNWSLSVASNVAWQLILSGVPMVIMAMLLEPFPDLTQVSAKTYGALLYLYGFPMIFCQWAYFKTVRLFPASIAAAGILMVPVIGVFSSSVILSEPVGLQEIAALVLICAALVCVLVIPELMRARARSNAG